MRTKLKLVLVLASLGALAVALVLALTPLGGIAGFVPLPAPLLAAVAVISLLYLASAEALKRVAIAPPGR